MLGRRGQSPRHSLALTLGVLLIVLSVMAVQATLGLVFDPRYRDFPFAPLWGATVPLLMMTRMGSWMTFRDRPAQSLIAAALVLSTFYIVFNETVANWQALWFCAGLIALAVTLLRVRDAQG